MTEPLCSGWSSRLLDRRAALRRLAALAGVGLIGACDRAPSSASREPGPLRVAVTVPPLAGLVRALAPDAELTILMAPGRSEHGYEFTPGDLARLGRADLTVYVGLGLEPRVKAFLSEHVDARRVDVCLADALGIGPEDEHEHEHEHHHEHEHGHEHEHEQGHQQGQSDPAQIRPVGTPGARHDYAEAPAQPVHDEPGEDAGDAGDGHDHGPVDPHLWLDVGLVIRSVPILTHAIRDASTRAGLAVAGIDERGAALLARLEGLDAAYREGLAPFKGSAIVTHHAAWGRLADRYGLTVAAVVRQVEGSEPTPGRIAASVEAIRSRGVSTLFVEPQFNPDAARRIAEASGVRLGTLDPLGDGDYFAVMERNLAQLVAGLAKK